MIKKGVWALATLAFVFFFSVPLGLADSHEKPGFHGWGDSQKAMTPQKNVEKPPEPIQEIPTQKKPAKKAVTKTPKAKADETKRSKAQTSERKRPKAEALDREATGNNDRLKKKIQRERKAFHKDTKKLRQEIYQKRLELRSELAKADPSARRARSIQKDITKRRAELDRMRLEHFLKLKKIDPEMGRRGKPGRDGYGGCPNCPYQDRGDRRGGAMMGPGYRSKHHMMGPGDGRHHMWEDDGEWRQRSEKGKHKRYSKKSSPKPPRAANELSQSDARSIVKDYLKSTRNPHIKLGKITDAGDVFQAEILTKDGSLVDKLLVDKESGAMRPAY